MKRICEHIVVVLEKNNFPLLSCRHFNRQYFNMYSNKQEFEPQVHRYICSEHLSLRKCEKSTRLLSVRSLQKGTLIAENKAHSYLEPSTCQSCAFQHIQVHLLWMENYSISLTSLYILPEVAFVDNGCSLVWTKQDGWPDLPVPCTTAL